MGGNEMPQITPQFGHISPRLKICMWEWLFKSPPATQPRACSPHAPLLSSRSDVPPLDGPRSVASALQRYSEAEEGPGSGYERRDPGAGHSGAGSYW